MPSKVQRIIVINLSEWPNDDDYDDETRAKARAGLTEAEDLVRNLENALEEGHKT